VIVFPGPRVKFHRCVVCGRTLKFTTASADTSVGPECVRSTADVDALREGALAGDRRRYRSEVLDLGFKVE
jgi:hypothetical protein